jgi:molybdopterin/thiamine biosynthesis adenylyltransferase
VNRAPRVLLVGVGGIGHPCALALARTGRVELVLLDDDRVERSNLHRLFAFDDADVGRSKAVALAERIERSCDARPMTVLDRATPDSVLALVREADVVVEGSDNFATKFLVADACALASKPSVHGAAVGWSGTVLPVSPSRSACYRCVFEDLPAGDAVDCATAGVFAPVTALVGAVMAAHALRFAFGDASQSGTIAHLDARTGMFRTRMFARRKNCPLCSEARVITAIDASRYTTPDCSLHNLAVTSLESSL